MRARVAGALLALLILTGCNSRSTFSGTAIDLRDRNAFGTCTVEFERNRVDSNAWPPEADQRTTTTFFGRDGATMGTCTRFFYRGLPDENSAMDCNGNIPFVDINCLSYCSNNRARVFLVQCVSKYRPDTEEYEDFRLPPA